MNYCKLGEFVTYQLKDNLFQFFQLVIHELKLIIYFLNSLQQNITYLPHLKGSSLKQLSYLFGNNILFRIIGLFFQLHFV